jgi:hypothetical protein
MKGRKGLRREREVKGLKTQLASKEPISKEASYGKRRKV